MILPLIYLLKVIICSGILYLYYHLALRNKLFHQWNRFYLLASVILSLLLPAVQWQVEEPKEESPTAGILYTIREAHVSIESIPIAANPGLAPERVMFLCYLIVSVLLFVLLILSVVKILKIIRTHSAQNIDGVRFISTGQPGTPFSFFQYIFWNPRISPASETGSRIFQHELVHVKEKHSLDKIFMHLTLVFFWINPFFWLIRKELSSIHEFVADERSTRGEGSAALAAMILQSSYQKEFAPIINQFFHTSIKRRIVMLTKKTDPRISYIARIVALPLMALVVFAFTIRPKEVPLPSLTDIVGQSTTDTIPEPRKQIRRIDFLKNGKAIVYHQNGQFEVSNWEWVVSDGYLTQEEADKRISEIRNTKHPLIIFNGKVQPDHTESSSYVFMDTEPEVKKIEPREAVKKYGDDAKYGAIEITGSPQSWRDPIFTKTEVPATIDKGIWINFLNTKFAPLTNELSKKLAPGSYTVFVSLVIETDGNVSDVYIVDPGGLSIEYSQLSSVLLTSPKWKPAVQNGKKVRSFMKQPITFLINPQGGSTEGSLATIDPEKVKAMTLHELAGVEKEVEILSCIFSIDLPNWDILEVKNSGNDFTKAARALIGNADKGLMLFVDAIVILDKDGTPKKMPSKAYKM